MATDLNKECPPTKLNLKPQQHNQHGTPTQPVAHPLPGVQREVVSQRFPEQTPLVFRGPGAGAEFTASGLFASLRRGAEGRVVRAARAARVARVAGGRELSE